jgi:hypothetical protein
MIKANDFDSILSSIILEQESDILKYNRLSEAEKRGVAAELVNSVFLTIKEKSLSIKCPEIEASKGDITKMKGFEDLEKSISFLMSMYSNSSVVDAPKEILDLNECLMYLVKYKKQFIAGFNSKNLAIQFLYKSITMALINATVLLIAMTIEYAKDSLNTYKVVFKKNASKTASINFFVENIRKFNAQCKSGKITLFFDSVSSPDVSIVKESFVGITLSAIAIVIAVIWIIKEFVYYFFYARESISSYLKYLSTFLDMNASSLGNNMKGTREKQERLSKWLYDMSEKISLDSKVNTKKAEDDIREDDKENVKNSSSGSPALSGKLL